MDDPAAEVFITTVPGGIRGFLEVPHADDTYMRNAYQHQKLVPAIRFL
jgi:hypothetical protein